MNLLNRRTRSAAALAAVAAVPLFAATQAASAAAPVRTASATSYTETTYLQHALGLPTSDTTPALETITYDRLEWQLQQTGKFAILIGDPALDSTFAARARDVELAAKAAGAKKVYWFDPNLSGNAQVGSITEPTLDIRNPALSTNLAAKSQTTYGQAWQSLIGGYLGDGITAVEKSVGTESQTVTITTGTATANDAGKTAGLSTKVGDVNGGALFDYSSGTPANVSDSYFFIYNKDNTAAGGALAKIVSWVDLTKESSSASTQADVTTAIGTVGGANITQLDQFAWWKSEVNSREVVQAPATANGGAIPVLSDADNADGWRVKQIPYGELVDLLKSSADAPASILFGGTWCPNTRPVLPFINREAQKNNTTVFNFDTVLDGGAVGGATTSSSNPLQSRNTVNTGSGANAVPNANPTSLYGDLVSQYLKNLVTEYNYTSGGPGVTYYPGGDTTGTLATQFKLQVPYLIGYQGNGGTAAQGGVNRQWIHTNADSTHTEYMSSWWFTNPQPNQLGVTTIPLDVPIWSTINAQLAAFDPSTTDPTTLYPNSAIDTDDAQWLDGTDTATVTYTAATGSAAAKVVVTSGGANAIPANPTALSAALSALGANAPSNLADAKTQYIAAKVANADTTNLSTVVAAWGLANLRKIKIQSVWGSAGAPNSVAGGLTAVNEITSFFAGLPGPVVAPTPTPQATPTPNPTQAPQSGGTSNPTAAPLSISTPTPTPSAVKTTLAVAGAITGKVATSPTSKKPGKYSVTITAAKGKAAPTGKITLKLTKGKASKTITGTVAKGVATFAVPKLAKGTWTVAISWVGDSVYEGSHVTGASIKVKK